MLLTILLTIAIIILLTILIDLDIYWIPSVIIIGLFIWYIRINLDTIGDFLLTNWIFIVFSFIIYILIGISWSFYKWAKYCDKNKYRSKGTLISPTIENEWVLPKVEKHYNLIIGYISYWPFSMIGFIVSDLFRSLLRKIINRLRKAYDNIAFNYINKK